MKKKILVTRSSMPDLEEYIEEIRDLWDSHWLTNMGEKHNVLERELKEYLQIPNISLFSNGHMALELVIQAMGFPEGGEVITTPFTFASTTHAIVRNGLKPIFCDISEDTYTIDASKIEELITDKTCAIVPVHVYGNVCDVEKIEAIALKNNLKVIYDAAHAFGISYKGRGIGSYGDASMFSFHATKVYNTIEGGAICFRDERLGQRLNQLKNFGIEDEEHVLGVGANAKMNEFQAAMGICNLRHIETEILKRKKVYERYLENLNNVPGIILPHHQCDVKPNYAYFPVLIDNKYDINRDIVYNRLAERGIHARKYFYPLTSTYECYATNSSITKTPIALSISKQVLTLPMYADLQLEDVDIICKIIKDGVAQ